MKNRLGEFTEPLVIGGDEKSPSEVGSRYDARLANEIELSWQARWEAEGTFNSPNPVGSLSDGFAQVADRPKRYVLDMFPYPSGSGLHVGHPLGYIGTDVYSRYLRMTGHNVLHPFGYDAFGLPAEQYAIETGQHPTVTTQVNIENMRRQLRRLGLGHDSRREISTTDETYYRWTQWMFLRIFNSWFDEESSRARPIEELREAFDSGTRIPDRDTNPLQMPWSDLSDLERRKVIDRHRLAYSSEEQVNWCPGLGTVLANEEITADGRSNVGNYPVYRRTLRQWMLRITAYAERLLEDLNELDWSDSIKGMQRNWIGRSDGATIEFAVYGNTTSEIPVFSTRPDTLPGATFIVLAPDHPLMAQVIADAWPEGTPDIWKHLRDDKIADDWTPANAVQAYREECAQLGEKSRSAEESYKSGVFTGSYAINPMTGDHLPVFVSDYVLMGYGSGAIMAVPAHDQRDLEFARLMNLTVRSVLKPMESWLADQGLTPGTQADNWLRAYAGGGPYVDFDIPGLNYRGLGRELAVEAAICWLESRGAGRRQRSYRLRDWLFSRQRYWGEPFPIVYDDDGLPVALPESMLPIRLPDMTDFSPESSGDDSSDPVPPLAHAVGWTDVELDLGEGLRRYRRELNTMPQWAGSCWYYLRYLDPRNSDRFVDSAIERYWMASSAKTPGDGGVDLYVGGVEHAVLHLLYTRFWHKVLFDLGLVSTREPFARLFNQGYVLANAYVDERGMYVSAAEVTKSADGEYQHNSENVFARGGKMGKSLKNSVSPDEIYAAYGADTFRLYEMGMGPLNADRSWRPDDIVGAHRFLQRLWRNIIDEDTGLAALGDGQLDLPTTRLLHRTIMVVRIDYQNMQFNTAIARLTELNNYVTKTVGAGRNLIPRSLAESLVLMVAPIVPHVAEELWSRIGHPNSLAYEPFPQYDEMLAVEPSVVLPVQLNGKRRFYLETPLSAGLEEIQALLQAEDEYWRVIGGIVVQKVVIVPGRIINIVSS